MVTRIALLVVLASLTGCGFHQALQESLQQPSLETGLVARARYQAPAGQPDGRVAAYNRCVRMDNTDWAALDACMAQAGYAVKP